MEKKNYGWKGFLPLFTFFGIYLGSGFIFSALGYGGDAFKQIPRMTGLLAAFLVCLLMGGKGRSLDFRMETFCKGMANQGTMTMVIIFLLAGAFSGVAKAMGSVQATANLGLSLIPSQFLYAGLFIISAFIATAMGTSVGTLSAIGPVAVAVAESAGLNMGLSIGAVLGGAMFGDNLSIISDTTIAAVRGCGCGMRDKFKMNGLIAGVSAVLAMIAYTIVGGGAEVVGDFSYDIIKVIPYIFIIVVALTGCNVFLLLLAGIGVSGAIGFATSSLTISSFAQAINDGMSGMYEICLTAVLLRGVSGVAEELGAIDWLVEKMHSGIKTRKGAEYTMAGMVSLFDAALSNNTIAIIIAAPLVRKIAAEHNIAPKRVASLLDIFSCITQVIIPHSGHVLLCITMTGLASPFEIIGANFYPFILAIATIITIQFGLLKTKEEKAGTKLYDENNNVIKT